MLSLNLATTLQCVIINHYPHRLYYKLPYSPGEYKMMDDGEERHSVYVEKYDRVLEEGEFRYVHL